MRQKVGKERNQGGCTPLANPHFFRTAPPEKVRPVAHPLEAMQNPGWSAQRHPRAAATAGIERLKTVQENCMPSATAGTVGRHPFLRGVAMPATCTSTMAFSPEWTAKRPVGARRILPSSRAGPNPLGENQSLSSPPLKPRGLLLSVMRQKVGKERSQGDCHPLGYPPLFSDRSPGESSARRPPPERLRRLAGRRQRERATSSDE